MLPDLNTTAHRISYPGRCCGSHTIVRRAITLCVNVRDEMYDVVSVLYHALQGAETCMQSLQDAQQAGGEKLVQFFQEVQECHWRLTTRAKEILAQCLEHGNSHESHCGMATGTQAHDITDSQAHSHGSQDAMALRTRVVRRDRSTTASITSTGVSTLLRERGCALWTSPLRHPQQRSCPAPLCILRASLGKHTASMLSPLRVKTG